MASLSSHIMDVCKDGGILVKILETSEPPDSPFFGEEVKRGASVIIKYEGSIASTGATFDARDQFSFVVGKGDVIQGLDLAITSLRVGQHASITLRHDYAYGENGLLGRIPPFAELHFGIKLLASTMKEQSDENTNSESRTKLALPPSGDDVPTLTVGGSCVQLNAIGPIVINSDGSTSRIANWCQMTEREQASTLRLIARRNKKRREAGGQLPSVS